VAFDAQGALKCDAQLGVFVDIEETKDEMVSEQPERWSSNRSSVG